MIMKFICVYTLLLSLATTSVGQKTKAFTLKSPNGKVMVTVTAADNLSWSVVHEENTVIAPSRISLHLQSGEILGEKPIVRSATTTTVNTTFATPIYKKKQVVDHFNQLLLDFKNDFGVIFRAYDDGVAYRFYTKKKGEIIIRNETADFNFNQDYKCFIPYVRDLRGSEKYINSFEALYDEISISKFQKDTLAFLPILADVGNNKKAVILEADLEDYPGMLIDVNKETRQGFKAVFAPYPLAEYQGGFNKLNTMISKRADYIAKTSGTRNFPWRAVVISADDAELANNDMVQKLASPSRINDVSWIKPGKVAWDWWSDWNISHVDFKAGINTPTYKYYIDFAAANKLEYIVIDEGWSNSLDLLKLSPELNLQELIDYGRQKNVGVILWSTWYAANKQLNEAFPKYAAMGIKGFKIDFMDRDDQPMVESLYRIAEKAAEHKLVIDYHGMYKPTGIQRTWPNILNFEGVKGLENSKWTPNDDVPRYDVSLPFIRMVAGPMDYTPGAMRNATKPYFRPIHTAPMSQGTRCHQLAMYVIFEAPLQMLADNPTRT